MKQPWVTLAAPMLLAVFATPLDGLAADLKADAWPECDVWIKYGFGVAIGIYPN